MSTDSYSSTVTVADSCQAYLGVTMITRLCNIIIRKPYLNEYEHVGDCLWTKHANVGAHAG